MGVRLQHLLQPAPLVRDMDEAMDHCQALFGIYPSERVHITPSGVDNAVYAFEGETFLELICPYDDDDAAGRLLARRGAGWHMVSFDTTPEQAPTVDTDLKAAGVRVVRRNVHPEGIKAWHMHPRDVAGALALVADRSKLGDNSLYAGARYKEFVGTNTRVVRRILGISWISDDAEKLADRLTEVFALDFDAEGEDGDSRWRQAMLPSGTWVQARQPQATGGTADEHLRRCGEGLYHIAFEVADVSELDRRVRALDLELTVRGRALWLQPHDPLRFPIELR